MHAKNSVVLNILQNNQIKKEGQPKPPFKLPQSQG